MLYTCSPCTSFFLLLLLLLSYHDDGRAAYSHTAAGSFLHKLFKVEHNFLAVQRTKIPPKVSKKAKPTVSGQKAVSSFFVLASASSNGRGSSGGGGGVISASQVTPTHFRDATMRALGKGKGKAAESGLDEAKKSEDITKAGVDSFGFEACVVEADIGTLRELLLPLGLNRERTLQRFATEFLGTAWVEPDELYGCGKFAADSWRTFCLGHWRTVHRDKRADKNLKAYAAFVARLHSDGAASDAATAGGAAAQEGRARLGAPPAAAAGRPPLEVAGAGAADGAAGLAPRVQRRRSNRIKNDDKVDCDEGKSQQQASSKKKIRIENGIELAASSKAGEVAKKRKRYAKQRKNDHGVIKPEKRGTFFQQATTPKRWLLRSTVAASSL